MAKKKWHQVLFSVTKCLWLTAVWLCQDPFITTVHSGWPRGREVRVMLPLPPIGSVKTANLAVSNSNGPLECDLKMFCMVSILDG